jgi:hypothetical protein
MSQLLSWLNAATAFLLFFSMSGITRWVIYMSAEAKIFPFILGILLLVNAVYLGFSKGEVGARRGA